MNSFVSTPLLAIALLIGSSSQHLEEQAFPIPGCGFCSSYSFLRCLNQTATFDSLREAFGDVDISGAVTIADIRTALAKLGVNTNAVRFSPADCKRLPTPSILYINPGRWPKRYDNQVGHFVTLVKYVDDRAVLLDWAGMTVEPAVHLPAAELAKYWDGDAIVAATNRWPQFLVLGIGASCIAVFRKHFARILFVFAVAASLGCSSKLPKTAEVLESTLVFDQPLGRLGEVSAKSMRVHEFEFRVWDKSSVVIRDIQAACGCTLPDKSLFGRELAAGSVHKLPVTIRVDGSVSTQAKSLRVITDPPSPGTIVLAVSYTRRDPPQLSVNRFYVESTPESFATGEIVVTYHRPVSDPRLTIDVNKSRFGEFSLIDSEQKYAEVVSNSAVRETVGSDTIRLQFRSLSRYPYGTHDAEMTIAFSDGSNQVIPTRIVVPHPIMVSSESIFAGMMKTGEVREKSIRIRAPENSNTVSASHVPGMITDSSIVSDRLTVRVVAPQQAGRHESIVTVTAGSLPPRKIPVVCIVKRE